MASISTAARSCSRASIATASIAKTGRTLTREQNYADVRLIKGANMNAVRMSHYPPDPAFLEAADELGLYVLDELAGWQGFYDTPTGARLIGQIVRRDVNHPSILFWDNGNEGGWNRENDGEFDRWDPQRRPVLHPWAIHSGINTDHYENYDSTVRLSAGPDIFMPTEFLHGLYDGGIGAGLRDYWDVMGRSPTVAGGFFWAFADEGIERTDQNGRIDNMGNSAPDGIVGAHHEKEGSYFAVKEIWSPVELSNVAVGDRQSACASRTATTSPILPRARCAGGQCDCRAQRTKHRHACVQQGEMRLPPLAPQASRDWHCPRTVHRCIPTRSSNSLSSIQGSRSCGPGRPREISRRRWPRACGTASGVRATWSPPETTSWNSTRAPVRWPA